MLVQELQNQDPTQPMDSTQMVGQMISLNQLDQLASINQLLTNTLGSSTATTDGTTTSSQASHAGLAAAQAVSQSHIANAGTTAPVSASPSSF